MTNHPFQCVRTEPTEDSVGLLSADSRARVFGTLAIPMLGKPVAATPAEKI
jgi:hypothetical protein